MRTIGVIGGMSWESTAVYYRRLNELVRDRLGGLHSAKVIVHSVDFAGIAAMQAAGEWEKAGREMDRLGADLARAGAEFLVLATNTMHKVAGNIEAAAGLPLVHIADVTAAALKRRGCTRPLLLATRFTMEDGFYRDRLAAHGIQAIVPDGQGRVAVHRIIYEELCRGVVSPASKAEYLAIIAAARAQGIDSVILGCTEIGLLISQADMPEPAIDTTEAHVLAAVDMALGSAPLVSLLPPAPARPVPAATAA
jgi:aspartate racemase